MSAGAEASLADPLFAPFVRRRGLLVAVSGGPDSMALLVLAARWRQAPDRPPVFCATVDHGLREGSADEAAQVAGWARALGVPHAILVWQGPKPATRLQERARDARYALLAAHARRLGADTLLTAHHADDQAETILFRLIRGSGIAGLAGMSAEIRRAGLFHARPLLNLGKADLVGVCDDARQPYALDPSNENPAFARSKLRRLLKRLEPEGLGRDAWLRLGRHARRADEALAEMFDNLADQLAVSRRDGRFEANIGVFRDAPLDMTIRLLGREIESVGGDRPRLDRLEALSRRLSDALTRRDALRATLGGAVLRLGKDGLLTIQPEAARRAARAPAAAPHNESERNCLHDAVKLPHSGTN